MLGVIFFLSFITTLLTFYSLYMMIFGRQHIKGRLQQYLNQDKSVEKQDKEGTAVWRDGLNAMGKTLGKSKLGSRYLNRIDAQLTQAHLMLKPEEFIAISAIAGTAAGMLGFIFLEKLVYALPIAVVGFFIPIFYLKNRKKGILTKIDQQLPDTIMLISNSLKSGHSFLQALSVAAKELPPPICLEFQQILKEVNLGVNTEVALEGLSQRVESEDLGLVIMAVLIQRQIGGNLSEILDNISDTIRSRIKIKGEVKVLTAQGRMSGMVISIMPVALLAFLFVSNPGYLKPLFTEPIGMAMLGMAAAMELLGIFAISKIVKIEV